MRSAFRMTGASRPTPSVSSTPATDFARPIPATETDPPTRAPYRVMDVLGHEHRWAGDPANLSLLLSTGWLRTEDGTLIQAPHIVWLRPLDTQADG